MNLDERMHFRSLVAAYLLQPQFMQGTKQMSTSKQLLTLEAFQAARQFTTDLGTALGLEEQKEEPGYVYPGSCFINKWDEEFLLIIENQSWTSANLDELEQRLYSLWYLPEVARVGD